MVTEEKVESIMSKALLKFSKKLNVPLKDFRINIRLDEQKNYVIAYCASYNKKEPINGIGWHEVVGGGITGLLVAQEVADSVTQKIHKLAQENNIHKESVNVMVYPTNAEAKPELRLLNGEDIIKKIELKDII